ncbi:MAG: RNA polymerase sigma factor [Pseudoflavonifractor sp.]|nr:RNA polymerase sigma factor [Pseudoflavonifractor sp.]
MAKKQLDRQTRQMLGEVIEANLNYLVRFATIRIGSKADAEDVVHEAVKRILEADISKIKRDSIRMYLFRIVYNLCKDFYISDRNNRPLFEVDNEIPDTSKEDELDMEEIERLNNLLDNLPEREVEVVRMNVIDELSFVEISQILSTPASTVKSRFKSGMDKLRKQYLKISSHG